jgi:hypothetical protein
MKSNNFNKTIRESVEEMCIKSIDYNSANISINVIEILLSVFKNF